MALCPPALDDPVGALLTSVVRDHSHRNPRHRQVAIGPSEIGVTCDRQLLYRSFDVERTNIHQDPWPSIVGVAVHGWLADAFRADGPRWLVEQRVQMTDGIGGTADLYDTHAETVIDSKVLGTDSMRKIKKGDVPLRYVVQLHLYGYGFQRAGRDVRGVALACWPRGGMLSGLHVWRQPYHEAIALAALDRLSRLNVAGNLMRLDQPGNPLWTNIESTPGPDCTWCPFWRPGKPTDTGGCAGPTT